MPDPTIPNPTVKQTLIIPVVQGRPGDKGDKGDPGDGAASDPGDFVVIIENNLV